MQALSYGNAMQPLTSFIDFQKYSVDLSADFTETQTLELYTVRFFQF